MSSASHLDRNMWKILLNHVWRLDRKNIFCLFCQFGFLYLGWLMRQKRTSSWVKLLAAAFKMCWHVSRFEIACKTSNSIFMSHIGKNSSNSSCGFMSWSVFGRDFWSTKESEASWNARSKIRKSEICFEQTLERQISHNAFLFLTLWIQWTRSPNRHVWDHVWFHACWVAHVKSPSWPLEHVSFSCHACEFRKTTATVNDWCCQPNWQIAWRTLPFPDWSGSKSLGRHSVKT